MQKVKLKAKWKKLIIDLILITFIVLFIVSIYHLINYKRNEKKINIKDSFSIFESFYLTKILKLYIINLERR